MPFVLKPLAAFEPIWSLLLLSGALGIAMLWVFSKTSNQPAIRATRNRLKASLMEMRLFGDEPSLILRAQRDLLTGNARLLALTLRPALFLTLPLLLLVAYLEPFYGKSPLPVGEAAIVTLRLKQPLDASVQAPRLEAPEGVAVEAPVRIPAAGEVSWRIRPQREVDGTLRVVLANEAVDKSIVAGPRRSYASAERASSWLGWLQHPGESRLPSQSVQSVEIRYPESGIRWLGLEMHWLVWLLVISMAVALLFKRRMGVSF